MAYPKTDPRADFPRMEQEILAFWRADDTFHKSLEKTKQGHPFSFYDGPPFGNGLPHWAFGGIGRQRYGVPLPDHAWPPCPPLTWLGLPRVARGKFRGKETGPHRA